MNYFEDMDTYGSKRMAPPRPEKREGRKDEEAFISRKGTCYRDGDEKEYTYDDLFMFTKTEEGTKALFDRLYSSPPEKALQGSRSFVQCKRCGTWTFSEGALFREKEHYCRFCTPLRTNGKIPLTRDPYDDDRVFTRKRQAVFRPGFTTLVGCNGAGKTTLINDIINELKGRGTPYFFFDNLGKEGGQKSGFDLLQRFVYGDKTAGSFEEAVTMAYDSSEGEKVVMSIGRAMKPICERMTKDAAGYGEFWLLADALDSGLSLDMAEDIKKYVFEPLLKMADDDLRVYIIVSSNSYEMSEGTACFSIEKMAYIPVGSYGAFKKAVLSSRAYKEERDKVFKEKNEIAERRFGLFVDEELLEKYEDWDMRATRSGDAIIMELAPYKLVVSIRLGRGRKGSETSLYIREGDTWKKTKCNFDYSDFHLRSARDELIKEMHAYLVRAVFLFERKRKK